MAFNNSNEFNKSGGESWGTVLIACEVINVVFAISAFWVLTSVIIYGIKTGRWIKSRGASSLNNGMIYIACTVTILSVNVRFALMEILYQATRMQMDTAWCNVMCHAVTISYGICTCATYFFVCMRQKFIYSNPFVKGKLGNFAIWMSRFAFLILSVGFIGLGCLYVLPVSYQVASYGCVLAPSTSHGFLYENTSDILLGVVFVVIQALLLCLSAYPVVRVKFEASADLKDSAEDNESHKADRSVACSSFLLRCKELFDKSGGAGSSPIKMAVRRTLIASLVIVVTGVILVTVDVLAVSRDFPIAVAQTIYDIGSMVNIFAILSTFGFAGDILTQLCPKKSISRGRRNQPSYVGGDAI